MAETDTECAFIIVIITDYSRKVLLLAGLKFASKQPLICLICYNALELSSKLLEQWTFASSYSEAQTASRQPACSASYAHDISLNRKTSEVCVARFLASVSDTLHAHVWLNHHGARHFPMTCIKSL